MWRTRIMRLASRAGMSPNAFVDALTVSIGAHSMYQTRLGQYLRDGYSREDAERKAVQDAEVLYNQTQQSSEGAFTSTMQVDRSWLSVLFTVFRNASMSYQRQLHDALRNLKRNLTPGGRARSIEFMTKQYVRDGIDYAQAEQNAKRQFRRQLLKDTVRVATFGYIMQLAWNLGAYLPYLLFGDDDDEKQKMWDDVIAHTMFGSVEGLTGGDVMSQAGQMALTGEGNPTYLSKDMPLTGDIMQMLRKLGNGKQAEALNDLIGLVVQSGIGVNPQSISDGVLGIMDACGNDPALAREATLCIGRIIQLPQSQLNKMYFDEVGLSGDEVSNYTPSELARRYARFKVKRENVFAPWVWNDQARLGKAEEQALNLVAERAVDSGDRSVEQAYEEHARSFKEVKAKLKSADKALREGRIDYLDYAETIHEIQQDEKAWRSYTLFGSLESSLDDITDLYLDSGSAEEASLCRNALIDYKRSMVDCLNAEDDAQLSARIQKISGMLSDFYRKRASLVRPNR